MADIEKAIEIYRNLREQRDDIKARHKDELRPITDKMYQLEVWLLAALQDQGAQSIKTPEGSVYKSVHTRAKVEDDELFFESVTKEELWHMLAHRLSDTVVQEYIEEHGKPPPGVAIHQDIRCNIRK